MVSSVLSSVFNASITLYPARLVTGSTLLGLVGPALAATIHDTLLLNTSDTPDRPIKAVACAIGVGCGIAALYFTLGVPFINSQLTMGIYAIMLATVGYGSYLQNLNKPTKQAPDEMPQTIISTYANNIATVQATHTADYFTDISQLSWDCHKPYDLVISVYRKDEAPEIACWSSKKPTVCRLNKTAYKEAVWLALAILNKNLMLANQYSDSRTILFTFFPLGKEPQSNIFITMTNNLSK